ncbi:hypothetical protein [uncultured Alistipes sp.]|uniref:hypothetical protein n=1 Tax=uncultured Alistipes sp. TaxID=538949 RepID=UPI00262F665D|nr:hypothetical protein [uncultured Alistipes sp.]
MEKCEFHTFSFCGLRMRRAALSAGAARAHTIAKAKLRKIRRTAKSVRPKVVARHFAACGASASAGRANLRFAFQQ